MFWRILPVLWVLPTLIAADLPITQGTLYKHGVAQLERSGELKPGETARLDFKPGDMNDVKALVANKDTASQGAIVAFAGALASTDVSQLSSALGKWTDPAYLARYMGRASIESSYYYIYIHTSPDFLHAYADITAASQSLLPQVGFE